MDAKAKDERRGVVATLPQKTQAPGEADHPETPMTQKEGSAREIAQGFYSVFRGGHPAKDLPPHWDILPVGIRNAIVACVRQAIAAERSNCELFALRVGDEARDDGSSGADAAFRIARVIRNQE